MRLLFSKFLFLGLLCDANSQSQDVLGVHRSVVLMTKCLMPFLAASSPSTATHTASTFANSIKATSRTTNDARYGRKLTEQVWTQVGPSIPGEGPLDFSVDISSDGKRVIVGGAHKIDGMGDMSSTGHARVFQFDGTEKKWLQVGDDIKGESKLGSVRISVGMSSDGKRVIMGAPFHYGNGFNSGHARVYEEVMGTWSQVGTDIDGEAKDDLAGFSVGIDSNGTRVIVGAHGNDGNGTNSGHARVFQESNNTWIQVGNDLDGDAAGDYFGESVGISSDGKRVIIGSSSSDGKGLMSGHIRVYEFGEILEKWVQVGDKINGEASGDLSGSSVDISSNGTRVVIGARWNDGNGEWSGHARVFQENFLEWVQVGKDLDGEGAGDWSGRGVSMSSDGSLVAIGAPLNQDNGKEAGHIRVYKEGGGTWVQVANDIDGEGAGDRFGSSVSISSDGKQVIGGAIYHGKEGSSSSGHARIFELASISASPSLTTKWLGIFTLISWAAVEMI